MSAARTANVDLQHWLDELEGMLESVQAPRQSDIQTQTRGMTLLLHELRRVRPDVSVVRSPTALLEQLQRLNADELRAVRLRSLYYATHDLVTMLAHRKIRRDAVAREEAVLYVHDRLQRDDFHRIDNFDPAHGASFKTYMWQVVSRLIIDFLRSRGPRDEANSASVDNLRDHEESPERELSDAQLRESIAALFAEGAPAIATRNALRDRLRAHLDLTSTERLFLKAVFQHDLSIDEVRRLPGFEMSNAEAWRFYYRLLERLLNCFKEAEALEALRSLAISEEPCLEVAIGDEVAKIEVTRIRYVKQLAADTTSCHAEWRGRLVRGIIGESLTRLKKKLAPWFTPVNATTLIADAQLRDMHELWRSETAVPVRIPGLDETFVIGRTQGPLLRQRFAEKKAPMARI